MSSLSDLDDVDCAVVECLLQRLPTSVGETHVRQHLNEHKLSNKTQFMCIFHGCLHACSMYVCMYVCMYVLIISTQPKKGCHFKPHPHHTTPRRTTAPPSRCMLPWAKK